MPHLKKRSYYGHAGEFKMRPAKGSTGKTYLYHKRVTRLVGDQETWDYFQTKISIFIMQYNHTI
jgi:hypothetical protein